MSIEAMKQALEALENNRQTHHYCEDTWYSCPKHDDGCANDYEGDECNCGADKANAEIDSAITSLRQAIAEAEKQEPVAYWNGASKFALPKAKEWDKRTGGTTAFGIDISLYTHPQPKREWVGLTPDEVFGIADQHPVEGFDPDIMAYTRAIEAKLKEKNT